jgi:hypothetical protein
MTNFRSAGILSAEYDALAIAITDRGWRVNDRWISGFLERAEERGAPGHLLAMCREATVPVVVKERALALVARRVSTRAVTAQGQMALAG